MYIKLEKLKPNSKYIFLFWCRYCGVWINQKDVTRFNAANQPMCPYCSHALRTQPRTKKSAR